MSDTPRTDGKLSQCHDAAKAMDWARELEREVSALRAENERLREVVLEVREHLQNSPVLRAVMKEGRPTLGQQIEAALADRGRG